MLPLLLGFTLWDATPEHDARSVLVVTTPGVRVAAYVPLVQALREDGHDVRVLSFGCGAHDTAALAGFIAEAGATLPPGYTVVAHGLGATLALAAAPALSAERYVLLAPVLDLWPVAVTTWLADQPLPPAVDLSAPVSWEGQDAAALLLGAHPKLGCAPAPFLAEVQGWVRDRAVPLSLEGVAAPVWIGVSAGDDVAALEAVVPASRRLADRRLVRLGMNRFDRQDYDHLELLTHPRAVARAVRAARRGR